MSVWLTLAAAGLGGVGLAHSYLGERYILIRLFRRVDLPRLWGSDVFTKRTLRFAWHLTTVAWWGAAGTLLALGADSPRRGVECLSVAFLVSAIATAVASRGRHLAWIVFLFVAIASYIGAPAR